MLDTLWLLCRGRGSPADLPASMRAVNRSLVAYTATTLVALLVFRGPAYALPIAVLSAALLGLFVWLLLALRRRPQRAPQTVTAVAGTGALMNLVVLPVYALIVFGGLAQSGLAAIVNLAAIAWSLFVVANIFRLALDERASIATLLALSYHLAIFFCLALVEPALTPSVMTDPALAVQGT